MVFRAMYGQILSSVTCTLFYSHKIYIVMKVWKLWYAFLEREEDGGVPYP